MVNLYAVEQRWARAGRISVYLRDGASDEQVNLLQNALGKTDGVESMRFVCRAPTPAMTW